GVKDGRDAIPSGHARHTLAGGSDHTSPVGDRNARARRTPAVEALDNQPVSVVQRQGAQLHNHLAWARYRVRPLGEDKRLDAEWLADFKRAHRLSLVSRRTAVADR